MNEIDKKIVAYLFEYESATTTELAKHCFDIKDRKDLISKDSLIRYHAQQLADGGIIEKSGNKKIVYSIEPNNVIAGDSTLHINEDDKISEIDLGFVIAIVGNNNKSLNIIMFDK